MILNLSAKHVSVETLDFTSKNRKIYSKKQKDLITFAKIRLEFLMNISLKLAKLAKLLNFIFFFLTFSIQIRDRIILIRVKKIDQNLITT